jgi:hypothetical protein
MRRAINSLGFAEYTGMRSIDINRVAGVTKHPAANRLHVQVKHCLHWRMKSYYNTGAVSFLFFDSSSLHGDGR